MRNRVYQRAFDWDEAKRLRAEGMTWDAIAEHFGVSKAAVRRVVVPGERERMNAYSTAYTRKHRTHSGVCPHCGGESSAGRYRPGSLCRDCATRRKAKSVRPDTLRCTTCRLWLPDEQFPHQSAHEGKSRRGRHAVCRPCQNVARALNRADNRERERAYERERKRRIRAAS